MKLNLNAALAAILRFGKRPDTNINDPVSMVLLLPEPEFPTADQLRSAAERAYGRSFAGGKDSKYCVRQANARIALMKVGPHLLSFLNDPKPYGEGEFPQNFVTSLPKASQRQVWTGHKAWTAVDYVKGGVDLELEYAVLARLCAEMLETNCVGLYVPREQRVIPNDLSLRGELQRIATSRDLRLT